MIKFIFFSIIPLLCLQSYAQQTFNVTYGTASDEYFSDLSVKNGNALIGGVNKNSDVYALGANKNGNLVFAKTFGTSLSEADVHCTITADNGSLFFLRRWINGDTPAEGAVLIKCNKNGDIAWSRSIKSKKYKFIIPVAVMENDDKSIMLLYGKNNAWYDTSFIGLAKLTGATLNWETTIYPIYQDPVNVISPRTLSRNGSGYIISMMHNDELYDQDWPLLYYVSGSGAVQYAKNLYDKFSIFNANHSIVENVFQRNGQTTVIGTYYGDNADESFFITSFKLSDSIIAANFVSHDIFSLQHYIKKTKAVATNQKLLSNVFLTQDYGLQVASSSVYTGQHNNIFLSKYDSLGRICPSYTLPPVDSSAKKYKYGLSNDAYNIVSDSIYVDTITFSAKNAGKETDICLGSVVQKKAAMPGNISVTASPNPATNFINIDFMLSKAGSVQLDVSSLNGKKWITKNVSLQAGKAHQQLNIEGLPSGMYFIKITMGEKQYNVSFLKE